MGGRGNGIGGGGVVQPEIAIVDATSIIILRRDSDRDNFFDFIACLLDNLHPVNIPLDHLFSHQHLLRLHFRAGRCLRPDVRHQLGRAVLIALEPAVAPQR